MGKLHQLSGALYKARDFLSEKFSSHPMLTYGIATAGLLGAYCTVSGLIGSIDLDLVLFPPNAEATHYCGNQIHLLLQDAGHHSHNPGDEVLVTAYVKDHTLGLREQLFIFEPEKKLIGEVFVNKSSISHCMAPTVNLGTIPENTASKMFEVKAIAYKSYEDLGQVDTIAYYYKITPNP